MVPVVPIITGVIFVFTFHMRCISISITVIIIIIIINEPFYFQNKPHQQRVPYICCISEPKYVKFSEILLPFSDTHTS
jgi:hypothetical protein